MSLLINVIMPGMAALRNVDCCCSLAFDIAGFPFIKFNGFTTLFCQYHVQSMCYISWPVSV